MDFDKEIQEIERELKLNGTVLGTPNFRLSVLVLLLAILKKLEQK